MNMSPLMFGPQDLDRFRLSDPARPTGVMFHRETCERLAHDQAHIQGQTRIFAGAPAWAIEHHDRVRLWR